MTSPFRNLAAESVQPTRQSRRQRCVLERASFEQLEDRRHLAAHIVGNSTTYATIQAAVNAAAAGAVVTVDAGTYHEQVVISKQLTIRGAKTGTDARTRSTTGETIVDGTTSGSVRTSAFYVTASDVTIDGFTIQGETNQSVSYGAGIVLGANIAGTHFINNIVQNNVAGMFLSNNSSTDAALIQHNLFQTNNNAGPNGGRGIYTDGTIFGTALTNVTVDANTFSNNRGGSGTTGLEAAIAFEAASAGKQSNIRITNNTFTNNGKSVLFFNTTGVLIQGNTASGAADWYSGSLRFEGNNQNVTIQYNNIINNPGPGVAVDSNGVPGNNSGFVVTNNNIYNNGTNSTYRVRLGVVFNQSVYTGTFDARNNYWGTTNGPSGDGPGTGDGVYGNASKATYWTVAKGGSELFSPFATSQININVTLPPAAPASLAASVISSSQINLGWVNSSSGQTSVIVQRSTDSATFATIATLGGSVTAYADTGLAGGKTYYYRVLATNAGGTSPASNTASAATLPANTAIVNLSDLSWTSATTGYGTVMRDKTVSGNAIKLNGVTYAKGLGTHAVSNIVYNLAGQYTTFTSDVGVDDEENGKGTGSVIFQVIGDGRVLFTSGTRTNGTAPAQINVSVAGVNQLTLVATNGVANSIDYDHADWAGARLIGTPTAPSAPGNLAAAALSASSIKLTWTTTSSNQTAFAVDRSTDGVNFTTISTAVAATATNWTDTSVLSSNTKYYYRIRATNSVGASGNSNIANATTLPLATVTYVSDLPMVSSTVGYGTIQQDKSIKGNPLTLNGVVYAKGIGTHAVSSITYNLAGKYSTFLSDVGVDDEELGIGVGSVDFQVIADGRVLFDSGVLSSGMPTVSINVSVAGVQSLQLVATNGVPDSIDYDHADWAGARLLA